MSSSASAASDKVITVRCPSCAAWNRVRGSRVADGPKCGQCSAAIALDHPLPLDDSTFMRTVRESGVPVMVDFYADWCGPCKQMAPAVDQLATKYQGAALIAKVDTEATQQTAGAFQIRAIPTTIVFAGGREVARQSGAMPFGALEQMLLRNGVEAR